MRTWQPASALRRRRPGDVRLWAGPAIAVVAVISCIGAMNGLILLSGQMPWRPQQTGWHPARSAKSTSRAPRHRLVDLGALAAVMTYFGFGEGELVDVYTKLLLISTLATLLPYLMVAAAELRYLIVDARPGPLPVPG